MAKSEKIMFHPEGEEPVEFYVLEQTRIGGVDYILVTDVEEGDGEAAVAVAGGGELRLEEANGVATTGSCRRLR